MQIRGKLLQKSVDKTISSSRHRNQVRGYWWVGMREHLTVKLASESRVRLNICREPG